MISAKGDSFTVNISPWQYLKLNSEEGDDKEDEVTFSDHNACSQPLVYLFLL